MSRFSRSARSTASCSVNSSRSPSPISAVTCAVSGVRGVCADAGPAIPPTAISARAPEVAIVVVKAFMLVLPGSLTNSELELQLLGRDEVVEAAARHQLLVRALFHDGAAIEHDDHIRVPDGR